MFYARCSSLSCGANVVTGLDVNRLNTSREEPWRGKNCFWFACECGQEAIVQYLARETQVDTGGAEAIPVTGEIIYELAAPELRTWIKGSKGFTLNEIRAQHQLIRDCLENKPTVRYVHHSCAGADSSFLDRINLRKYRLWELKK